MKNNILLRTNVFICIVIIIGFIVTSIISYHSNKDVFEQDAQRVAELTAEGILNDIESIFTRPVNISMAMANDSLLKGFLAEEDQRIEDEEYIRVMKDYLGSYQRKYGFDSVFLVSTETNRYYHYHGIDRVLTPENPENVWYYEFLQDDLEYALNIDNDEAAGDEITVFINCKIRDLDDKTLGVVGVGFRVEDLQDKLSKYADQFDIQAFLLNKGGMTEISTESEEFGTTDFFAASIYPGLRQDILSVDKGRQEFLYAENGEKGCLVTQYVPILDWFLVIDNNTSVLNRKLSKQFLGNILIIIVIILAVLFAITRVFRRFNEQIVRLTVTREQEHRTLFREATEKLYENIYELDITHNRAASEATEHYFESLGVPANTPYDEALYFIARKQIKEEHRQGYIDTFSPDNVLKAFQNGTDSLYYDFLNTNDGVNYYWMRITAKIFYWDNDQSIRMFTYRQNIDAEKQQENKMLAQMERDSLSGLLNKAATQKYIRSRLKESPAQCFAFFMLDIDNFKQINDQCGHAVGDVVIADFAGKLRALFEEEDLVGRIGGDEFAVFVAAPDRNWVQQKAAKIVSALRYDYQHSSGVCKLSASIGIAMAPEQGKDFETLYKKGDFALYQTKRNGKDGYTFYREQA